MTFSTGGSFDGGRVQTGGGFGGGGFGGGFGRGPIIGGGIGGTILLAILGMIFGGGGLFGGGSQGPVVAQQTQYQQPYQPGPSDGSGYVGACTAEQANTNAACQVSATAQALDAYWTQTLPNQAGVAYTKPGIVDFTGETQTGCGPASNATGPFYCPADQTVYIDTSFYDELVNRFGSSGGPLAREYVLAHEVGHHIENELGVMQQASSGTHGATSDSVRIELMADCFAGMWAGAASNTVDPSTGVPYLQPLTQQDVQDAISAASAVGDDHIQQAANGYVNPQEFTHGTSQQRAEWFLTGYQNGTIQSCNTLAAQNLG